MIPPSEQNVTDHLDQADHPVNSVGILGLGIIGERIAAHVRSHGNFPVFLWNRSARPDLHCLASPLDVVKSTELIQIFVRDGVALLEVLTQIAPALTPRHLVLSHPTVSPLEIEKAAAIVLEKGAQFLDAPFTGSRDAAAAGKLIYYVGGSSKAIQRATPLLKISSQEIISMGSIGTATMIKLATNIIMGVQIKGLAEALTLLKVADVSLDYLVRALEQSAANSPVIRMKLKKILDSDFEPHFSTKNMLKDLEHSLNVAADHDVNLAATAVTASSLKNLVTMGLGDQDYSVLGNVAA